MDPNTVASFVQEWQRILPGTLTNLFDFYSQIYSKTERVISYEVSASDLVALKALNPASIRIWMGCEPGLQLNEIPMKPGFVPFLQARPASPSNEYEYCFKLDYMQWGVAPFDNNNPPPVKPVVSDPDWISSKTAHLFMLAWFECGTPDLAKQFHGIGVSAAERVRFYQYPQQETDNIMNTIKTGTNPRVYLHLGLTLPVSGHPFGFRPVIEITTDDGGQNYYEFSNPCPPNC